MREIIFAMILLAAWETGKMSKDEDGPKGATQETPKGMNGPAELRQIAPNCAEGEKNE